MCALSVAGCAHHGEIDELEAELRQREQVNEELTRERDRALDELKVAESDRAVLRSQLNKHHQVSLTQEQADVAYRAEGIKFNMLLTSGQDRDGQPGDEGISVMLIPIDAHGDQVKLVGEVELDLFDMTLPTEQQRLGKWSFTMEEVRASWHSGFISTGYLFQVDWQKRPVAKELTLHARLTIPDGRKFNATTQIKVEPPAASSVARTGKPPHRNGPSSPLDRQPEGAGVSPASATVNARRPGYADANDQSRADPPPKISPRQSNPRQTSPGQPAAPPGRVRTSDKWTEETIPTVR